MSKIKMEHQNYYSPNIWSITLIMQGWEPPWGYFLVNGKDGNDAIIHFGWGKKVLSSYFIW